MKRRLFLFGIVVALPLLVAASAETETLRFTVIGIDCKECAPPLLRKLKEVDGVRNATLDWKAGTATVEVPAGFDRTKIKKAVDAIGYEADEAAAYRVPG